MWCEGKTETLPALLPLLSTETLPPLEPLQINSILVSTQIVIT